MAKVYLVGGTYDNFAGCGYYVTGVCANRLGALALLAINPQLKDRELIELTEDQEFETDDDGCAFIMECELQGGEDDLPGVDRTAGPCAPQR